MDLQHESNGLRAWSRLTLDRARGAGEPRFMRAFPPALVILALLAPATAFAGDVLRGVANAVDGDTLELVDWKKGQVVRIRLAAIDTPEMSDWPRGVLARASLDAVTDGDIVCIPTGEKSHGRVVARCGRGVEADGETLVDDLALHQLRQGWAVVWRTYTWQLPTDTALAYDDAEREGRVARRGIYSDWRGDVPAGKPERRTPAKLWLVPETDELVERVRRENRERMTAPKP